MLLNHFNPSPRTPNRRGLILCILLATAPTFAAENPTPEALERGLVGTWAGALAYRDYQSNARFELPVNTRIELGPDGATFTRLSRFDDGPKTGFVHITTVSLFDKGGAGVTHASFRKDRAVEMWREEVRVLTHSGPQDWTLVYHRRGTDGSQPADIRITQTRRGDGLTSLKEVKAPDQPDSAYGFRNETLLKRMP